MKSCIKLLFFALLVSFSLTSRPVQAEKSVEKYAKKIDVEVDDFDGDVTLRSANISTFKYDPYRIITTLEPKTGRVYHLLYVDYDFTASNASGRRRSVYAGGSTDEYRDWVYARDAKDNRFTIKEGQRSFGGCSKSFCYFNEPYGIIISEGYVNENAETGLKLRAVSRSGIYMDITVPANYLKAIIQRLAQEKAARGID